MPACDMDNDIKGKEDIDHVNPHDTTMVANKDESENQVITHYDVRESQSSGRLAIVCDTFQLFTAAWGERGVRKFMEDTHVVCLSIQRALMSSKPNFPRCLDAAVFAIFDGHGGKQTSMFCRDNLILEVSQEILRLFANEASDVFYYTDRHVRKLIKAVFAKLDSRISTELPGCKDGSTVILAFFPFRQLASTMYFACLGDAAAYLSRTSKGMDCIIPLNDVHKPWMVKEKTRILNAGGVVESGRVNGFLEVSRSLGDLSMKKYGVSAIPSIMKLTIDPAQDNLILLGCDGFWVKWTAVEALSKAKEFIYKETRRLVTQGVEDSLPDLKTICQDLVNYVLLEKKSQDNVSIIVIHIKK